jgi:Holliday junction resolvase RusA-like endonuclease
MKFESVTLTIRGRLPGLNEIVDTARRHRFEGHRQKATWTEFVAWEVAAARLQPMEGPVEISIDWIEKDARRDIDNVAAATKFIFDGLVMAGVLARGDGRRRVVGLKHRFPDPDRKNPRIVVTLQLVGDADA